MSPMDVDNAEVPAWVGEHDPNYPDTMDDRQQYAANAMNKGKGKGNGTGQRQRRRKRALKEQETETAHTRAHMEHSQAIVDGAADMGTNV